MARFCTPEDLPDGREKVHGRRELFFTHYDDIEVRKGSGDVQHLYARSSRKHCGAEWQNGRMAEWQNGRMVAEWWQNGGGT